MTRTTNIPKAKKIYMTDKMLREIQERSYASGKRYADIERAVKIAEALGLYDIFQTAKEDY